VLEDLEGVGPLVEVRGAGAGVELGGMGAGGRKIRRAGTSESFSYLIRIMYRKVNRNRPFMPDEEYKSINNLNKHMIAEDGI